MSNSKKRRQLWNTLAIYTWLIYLYDPVLVTHQPDEDTEQLDDVGIGDGIEAAD